MYGRVSGGGVGHVGRRRHFEGDIDEHGVSLPGIADQIARAGGTLVLQMQDVVPEFDIVIQDRRDGDVGREIRIRHPAVPFEPIDAVVRVSLRRILGITRRQDLAAPPGVVVRLAGIEIGAVEGGDLPAGRRQVREIPAEPALAIGQAAGGLELAVQGAGAAVDVEGVLGGGDVGGCDRDQCRSESDGDSQDCAEYEVGHVIPPARDCCWSSARKETSGVRIFPKKIVCSTI